MNKNKYVVLWTFIIAWIIISCGLQTTYEFGTYFNVIDLYVFTVPIQILTYLYSKDESLSITKRKISKFVFWFLTVYLIFQTITTIGYFALTLSKR